MNTRRLTSIDSALEPLARDAEAEGHQNIRRLIDDFRSGRNRFTENGEVLIGVFDQGVAVAVGGLNIDPYLLEPSNGTAIVGRIRRVYVHPEFRRAGVGRLLIRELEEAAVGHFQVLRLYTTSIQASAFYESIGFSKQSDRKVSHLKHARRALSAIRP